MELIKNFSKSNRSLPALKGAYLSVPVSPT